MTEQTTKPDFNVEGEDEELKRQSAEGEGDEDESLESGIEDPKAEGAAPIDAAGATAAAPPVDEAKKKGIEPARFQRVNDKLAETLQENERLKAELAAKAAPTAAEVDIKELRKELRQALYSGDDARADELEDQIEAARAAKMQQELQAAEARAVTRVKAESAQELMTAKADELTALYPFLDANSEEANQEAIDEVVALRDLYASRGKPAHLALEAAVKKIAPMYGAAATPTTATDLSVERQRRALQKAGATSTAQPAPVSTTGVGTRSGTLALDGKTMSDEQIKEVAKDPKAMFATGFGKSA